MKKLLPKALIVLVALLVFSGCSIFRRGKKQAAEEPPLGSAEQVAAAAPESAAEAGPPAVPVEGAPAPVPGSSEAYVLNDLNFEIKKMGAELQHLASELRDLQARSTMWANPLTIYNKEIILDNGSTIFGKIVYQDEKILKVETLIGYLIIERPTVVRIVENVSEAPLSDGAALESTARQGTRPPAPANRVMEPSLVTGQPPGPARSSFAANVVLLGAITESKDRSGNLKLAGAVKNIGGRRADFVKVNFVFRKDWSGNTKTLTSFVKGSFHTFESGINSESSVLPGASATIELYVPKSFGTFIGYSYTIDWEEY